jgi:hypothetical protein
VYFPAILDQSVSVLADVIYMTASRRALFGGENENAMEELVGTSQSRVQQAMGVSQYKH